MNKWLFLVLPALLAFSSSAQAERIRLGAVSLMDVKDRDVVTLPKCDGTANKKVTRLQLSVAKFDAEIDRLKVQFHNGETQFLNVRDTFKAGTTSRWIDLSGTARCISKITILGDTQTRQRNNRLQSRITFWGDSPSWKIARIGTDRIQSPKPIPVRPSPVPVPVKQPPQASNSDTIGVRLGQVRLTDAKDRDVINLASCKTPANVKVNRVRLKIKDHPAEINRFKVEFYNGEMQVLDVKEQFKANTNSRWIDLKGAARCIKQIVIIGDTESIGRRPGKQATVVVRGLHFTDSSPAMPNKPKPIASGAVIGGGVDSGAIKPGPSAARINLGSISLMDQKDRDVVNLAPCRSSNNRPVTRIQVQVQKFDAEIDRLSVQFHNGEKQILNVRERFKAGSQSRWIDLSGNARCIQKIVVLGDTDTRRRTNRLQSRVTFWGINHLK